MPAAMGGAARPPPVRRWRSSCGPPGAVAVDRDREDEDEALEDGLPVGRQAEEDQRGGDGRQEADAEENEPDIAASAGKRDAGEDDRRDHRQEVDGAGGDGEGTARGGEEDSGNPGEHP